MSHDSYKSFARLVLGLYHDTWALHRTERAFQNLIIQDLDTIMYYWDTDIYNINCKPMSYRSDRLDMACTLARLTLLLTGADACTPCIVASVWGEDEAACFALSSQTSHPLKSGNEYGSYLDERPRHEFSRANLTQLPTSSSNSPTASTTRGLHQNLRSRTCPIWNACDSATYQQSLQAYLP